MDAVQTFADRERRPPMDSETLLREISDYCRLAGMAESTFGRRAVNDGKFVSRLRYGGRVTLTTVERVHTFIESNTKTAANDSQPRSIFPYPSNHVARTPVLVPAAVAASAEDTLERPEQNFRFFDNRQKYLMFVNTTSEKLVVSRRVDLELGSIRPRPPAVRLFDAGVGDGTVLTRLMRSMHRRFERMPFYIVGKEISLEDVRLALEKFSDRFQEHPATVLVMTNLNYAEAPWLVPSSPALAAGLVWHEIALRGTTAGEFDEQITDLHPFLAENWRARVSKTSGNPVYEKPVVLVLYREDCRFLLDSLLPRRGAVRADYDLVVASQAYRARAPVAFKANRVIAPLTRSLAPGGRLIGIHSCGGDPGLEIVRGMWPDENPFKTNRYELLRATKAELGKSARHYNFNTYADARSVFRYDMNTLPNELDAESAIGTSTLLAAWNAATYVAQIEDQRLTEAMASDLYLKTTREVLRRNQGLWFFDESYVISRKADLV